MRMTSGGEAGFILHVWGHGYKREDSTEFSIGRLSV